MGAAGPFARAPLSTDTLGFLLLHAAETEQRDVAHLLLLAGADVNYLWRGYATPLTYAIDALDPYMMLWLLRHGANIHHRSNDDETFLHLDLLLDTPIDVNAEDKGGWTVLDMLEDTYWPGAREAVVARSGRRGSRIHHAPPDRTQMRDREAALLATIEARVGPWHPDTATQLIRFAQVEDDDAPSDAAYARALAIRERTLGPDHPDTVFLRDRLT